MIFLYAFIAVVITILLIAAFLPKVYNIEKTIIINCPPTAVMKRVGDFNEYANWNPFIQAEPGAVMTITGAPSTPGHNYVWQGKKIGSGILTLKSIDDKHIHFNLEFIKPWKSQARDNWLFEHWHDNDTKVTWQNSGALPWPVARLMNRMISKNLNQQFEKGLAALKRVCEN